MKVTPVNSNCSFGYNKRLNNQLKQRLEQSPKTPINDTIYQVNELCNATEDKIKKLEGENYCKTNKNERSIDILLDWFLDAKVWLCQTVDSVFPDLNYLQTECDTYDEEASSKITPDESCVGDTLRNAYIWRETLVDDLIIQDEVKRNLADNSSAAINPYAPDTSNMPQLLIGEDSDDVSSLVEKFHPYSHSPKSLDDVVGLDNIIDDIQDLIIYPLEKPNAAKLREHEYGIEIPHFILFYGPPGCGKTMLSEAIAAQTDCDMYKMDVSKIGSSYINKSAINIAKAFDYLSDIAVKSEKPLLLFMDEMDSLLTKRSGSETSDNDETKVVNTLLQQIVAAKDNNIIIIGATNMYDLLDSAVKDRAKMQVYIGLPNDDERCVLISNKLNTFEKGQNLASDENELMRVSKNLREYSPRSILSIIEKASLNAYRAQKEVSADDIIKVSQKSTYQKINEKEYKQKDETSKMGF